MATLMRRMEITAVYRTPRTSQRHPAHRVYPSLLRDLAISRPNHVWAADITVTADPLEEVPWLREHRQNSVTEMALLHGYPAEDRISLLQIHHEQVNISP